MAVAQSLRNRTTSTSSSSRVRLHLQTIFGQNPLHFHRATKSPNSGTIMSSSSTMSSVKSSPSSSFSNFGARIIIPPSNDLTSTTLSPIIYNTSPSSSHANYIRRQPSAIDLALEEERSADVVEMMGLGLLEPRPRANTASTVSTQCSMMEFMTETMQTPAVLDGIFEVMERA